MGEAYVHGIMYRDKAHWLSNGEDPESTVRYYNSEDGWAGPLEDEALVDLDLGRNDGKVLFLKTIQRNLTARVQMSIWSYLNHMLVIYC